MKDYFIPEHAIMDFEFYDQMNVGTHLHQNLELLTVLEGSLTVSADDGELYLERGGYCLINANRSHALKAAANSLYICLHINFQLLCRYVDMNRIVFQCNSKRAKAAADRKMKKLLAQIVSQYFAKNGMGQVKLNALYYELLDILINEFLVYSDTSHMDRRDVGQIRLNEIVNYVYANYRNNISLNDLAEKLYLSPAYLSKYIKSHLKMNFTDYVNSVRLYFATNELQGTDRKILNIAIDNGFPNISAFNKAFRKTHHVTPTEYREQVGKRQVPGSGETQNAVTDKVRNYLESQGAEIFAPDFSQTNAVGDAYEIVPFAHYWSRMINIGPISCLTMSDMQEHILMLHEKLGFRYVRIWDIFGKELDLNLESGDGTYNFGKMDRALDFLHEHHIYPYIEIGFKPKILLKALETYIVEEPQEIAFPDWNEYGAFLYAMLTHYVNRYGLEEVEHWYFELWKDHRLVQKNGDCGPYLDMFAAARKAIKAVSYLIRIGGGSFQLNEDENIYMQLLSQWKQRGNLPDFLSLYSYPYFVVEAGDGIDRRRSQNPDYLKEQVQRFKAAVSQLGIHIPEFHVSEWSQSISNRNYINDSVYQGAYIVKNVLDNIDHMDLLGYWLGSDLFSQAWDRNQVLGGGVGLLSRDGIRKPAYFAFRFLNRLGNFVIGRTPNTIITSNRHDDYAIVSHNYAHPNYRYYAVPENEMEPVNLERYFSGAENLRIDYCIKHVRNGKYRIKVYKINSKEGSVLNEWIRLGQLQNLEIGDLNYLRHISTAKVTIWENEVYDSTLKFQSELQPNEIQFIHISYRF